MNNNNDNNNSPIEIWNNCNTITIELANRGDPYDTTTDTFFLDQFPLHGAGNSTNETVGGIYNTVFKRGANSVSPTDECPICMESYNTAEANHGDGPFPIGFSKCPVKFLCGFICCLDCLWNWIDEKGTNHWTCFSCRTAHTSALFLKIEEPIPVSVTLRTPTPSGCNCHETMKEVFDALETSHRKIDRLDAKNGHLRNQVSKLEKENDRLKKQIANLKKRKLEEEDPTTTTKKIKLFPSSSSKKDK